MAGLFRTSEADEFVLLSVDLPMQLFSVDRTTSEVYRELFRRSAPRVGCVARFRRVQVLSVGDEDQAIAKAIRAQDNQRAADQHIPTVAESHIVCEVHVVYLTISKPLAHASDWVIGQIRFALSLRGLGSMRKFRSILLRRIVDELDYRRQTTRQGPGQSADAHRKRKLPEGIDSKTS